MASFHKPTLHLATSTPFTSIPSAKMSSDTPESSFSLATPPETPTSNATSPIADWGSFNTRFQDATTARRTALLSLPPAPPAPYTDSPTLLGTGAWSRVTRGSLLGAAVAIKRPVRADAVAVLEAEARVLSYVSATGAPNIARYLGFDLPTSSLLTECIPGPTLADFSRAAPRATLQRNPVIGLPTWLSLASQLTAAFSHLKTHGIVHGDMTWNNVLVTGTPPTAVLIDFSSAHLVVPGFSPEPISAVTTGFCAPELLESFIRAPLRSPPPSPGGKPATTAAYPVPSHASDLYGLAMTLLCAAIGTEVYANAGRHVGIYARNGQPLEWVRAGDSMLVVAVRGVVTKVLNGCFGKTAEGRSSVEELQARVHAAIAAL
ncbi:kinase-like domain-containing protein [Geopyxis carbonaria]|nr:kinase-like domain-containing protein [Geopyxis carbonaria]